MLLNRPSIQIQSPSSCSNTSRRSLAERLEARIASKTFSQCPISSDKENLNPNSSIFENPLSNIFQQWKVVCQYQHALHTLPQLLANSRKREALRRIHSKIQIKGKSRKVGEYLSRRTKTRLFEKLDKGIIAKKAYQLEKILSKTRKSQTLRDLLRIVTAQQKFKGYVRELDLNRYFVAWKSITQQQRKIQYFRRNTNIELMYKAFLSLKKMVNTKARVKAIVEVKETDLCFEIFHAWKAQYLTKKLIRYNQEQLTEIRQSNNKAQFIIALKNHQSLKDLNFIKQKQADRYNLLRIYSLFYPFVNIIKDLQLIRIKSIKLKMTLSKKRSLNSLKQILNDFRNKQRKLKWVKKQLYTKLLKKMYIKWQRITQINFINRKQYQLSQIFHKSKLQLKSFQSFQKEIASTKPIKQKSKQLERYLKLSHGKVFTEILKCDFRNSFQLKKLSMLKNQNRKQNGFKQLYQQTYVLKEVSQSNWQLRKKGSALTKFIKNNKKQLGMRVIVSYTKFILSKLLLEHYADEFHRKHLLQHYFAGLLT